MTDRRMGTQSPWTRGAAARGLGDHSGDARGAADLGRYPGMRHQNAVRRISQSLHAIPAHPAACGSFDGAEVSITQAIKRQQLR